MKTVLTLLTLLLTMSTAFAISPSEILEIENEIRGDVLVYNDVLERSAQAKADHMAKWEYFAHTDSWGRRFFYWTSEYDYLYLGENLAVKFKTSQGAVDAWMASPTHKANILSDKYIDTGIGIAKGNYKGVETEYVVQLFGTEKPTLNHINNKQLWQTY